MFVRLPISKSIANRLLILQAQAGVSLLELGDDTPSDVRVLHDALMQLNRADTAVVDVGNCGTAMRFLTAFCALSGKSVVLTGCERMHQRPIGQLVDALRTLGADIEYIEREGYPPLRIQANSVALPTGARVVLRHPQSTQFVSALLLMGVEVETDSCSPYIEMTRQCIRQFTTLYASPSNLAVNLAAFLERDWSSAAFWYEWVALHGGELCLQGLSNKTLQGDKVVVDLFLPLGVSTTFTSKGIIIRKDQPVTCTTLKVDFSSCPDLYPALAIACEQLGILLQATGVESLCIKESDRLRAVAEHKTYGDHRIAMALLAADLLCDDTECIGKSYPKFLKTLSVLNTLKKQITTIVPRRGVNDDGKGKKYALNSLISQATTDYVWLMDDDIVPAPIVKRGGDMSFLSLFGHNIEDLAAAETPDLIILPIRMQIQSEQKPNLLERLQIAEYAAIQGLTIWSARCGHPVMCSSANLIVRRDRWLEAYADLHLELASGDDMFLLESFKRRGLRIALSEDEELTAIIRPIPTWRAFLRQRMRWAGKAPAYKDRDIITCGSIVLLANIIQIFFPPLLLVKFPIEYAFIRSCEPRSKHFALNVQFFFIALLLEILYPFYILFSLIGGVLCTQKRHQVSF